MSYLHITVSVWIAFFLSLLLIALKGCRDIIFTEDQKNNMKVFIANLWDNYDKNSSRELTLAFATKFNSAIDSYFGKKLISKKAFYSSAILGTFLLASSAALTGLQSDKLVNLAPWKQYDRTVFFFEKMKSIADNELMNKDLPDSKKQGDQQLSQFLEKWLSRAEIMHSRSIYIAAFFVSLLLLNSITFYTSIIIGRYMLRLVIANQQLTLIWLLTLNHAISILCLCSFLLLILTFLSVPPLILLAIAILGLSVLFKSIYFFLFSGMNAMALALVLASSSLTMVAIIAVIPSGILYLPVFITKIALRFPVAFKKSISWVFVRLCDKGPLEFVLSIVAALVAFALALNLLFGQIH